MFIRHSKKIQSIILTALMFVFGFGLTACNSEPPELMKAVKQFKSDEVRDAHVKHMRKNHMDELLHKRDETMIKGIRTKKYSLKACINCHIPEKHNGEVLRHTNPEHFCSTCHGYVAAQLDCFQCHVDHPVNTDGSTASAPSDSMHSGTKKNAQKSSLTSELKTSELKSKTIIVSKKDLTKDVKGESASE
jgi:hypothetical protein